MSSWVSQSHHSKEIGSGGMSEKLVVHLFMKYHKLLGFEEILKLQERFPDVTALKNGKKVRIEIESESRYAQYHHFVIPHRGRPWYHEGSIGEWIYDKDLGMWGWYDKYTVCGDWRHKHMKLDREGYTSDPDRMKKLDYNGRLIYKNLSYLIDYVVCWNVTSDLDDPYVKVICLRTELEKMGIDLEKEYGEWAIIKERGF